MNIHELRKAQAIFEPQIKYLQTQLDELHAYRKKTVRYFSPVKILSMSDTEYSLGYEHQVGDMNFCYALERKLDGLGRMTGSTAIKFGVYYGQRNKDGVYKKRWAIKYGNTYHDAFKNIKQSIYKLIDDGKHNRTKQLVENPLSTMFKGKILAVYYPDKYLNIFSDNHLEYFLTQLDLDSEELLCSDAIYKREALLKFKNDDPIMKKWRIDIFARFLYNAYPGHPDANKNKSTDLLEDYRTDNFPPVSNIEAIELEIAEQNKQGSSTSITSSSSKTDYEKEARKLKQYGDRGEKIVEEFEKDRLKKAKRSDLAKRVNRVSLKSDSYGYDILSFETDGTPRHIEVKATSSKVGNTNFFISANEMETASTDENYRIYMVYDILSSSPKVWDMGNIFKPENKDIMKTPTTYKIGIKVASK